MFYLDLIVDGIQLGCVVPDGLLIPDRLTASHEEVIAALRKLLPIYDTMRPLLSIIFQDYISLPENEEAARAAIFSVERPALWRTAAEIFLGTIENASGVTVPHSLVLFAQALINHDPSVPRPIRQTEGYARPKDRPGYIYLIAGPEGLYKIGRASNVIARFRAIANTYGRPVRLIHSFPAAQYIAAEREIHARFASKRAFGEWFRLDEDDVDAFISISEM